GGSATKALRLRGGNGTRSGRVEIYHSGSWEVICYDGWDIHDAFVACRQLGFSGADSGTRVTATGVTSSLKKVQCTGSENTLGDCVHNDWSVGNCSFGFAGVICTEEGTAEDEAYVGCYRDTNQHVMTHEFTTPAMTLTKCIRRCQSKGFMYAGLEWANECYCGNHYDRYGNATSCDLPCHGDSSKICGGPWALSVYNTDPAIVPTAIPGHAPVTQSCTRRIYYHVAWQYELSQRYYGGDHRSGWISSPDFPSNYFHSTVCIWVLTLLPGTRAKITFKSFLTEHRYDFVEVRDGEKDYSVPYLTPGRGFSGNLSYSVMASANVMWIKFNSDATVSRQGFNLTYEAFGAPTVTPPTTPASTTISPSQLPLIQIIEGGCNGISHDVNTTYGYFDWSHNSGFVQSPGYPANYPNEQICRWSIKVAPGYRIFLTVDEADVAHAARSGGLGDMLQVDDGISVKSSHHSSAPWTFLSIGRRVRVLFITDERNSGKGFRLRYERVPSEGIRTTRAPGIENTFAPQVQEGMKPGTIAGIVVPILLLPILLVFIYVMCKTVKKRDRHGVRHGFVNEAYDNMDAMNMTTTPRSAEYAQPVTANRSQPSTQSFPNQEPAAYFTVAPPPYSQAAPGNVYLVPFAAGGMVPVGVDNPGYAQLYTAPPAYEASARSATHRATTTGIGSVTSLREAAKDDGASVPNGGVAPATVFVPLSRAVLPPIRGPHTGPEPEKQPLPHEDEAGPLPEKPPLTVDTPPEPTAPPRPPSASSQIRVVSPAASPEEQFNAEVPFEFLCPITNKQMKDPVTAADGYNYERRAIRRWFRKKRSSPMTNETLTDLNVRPNDELRNRIESFVGEHTEV
ncbi:hypothetical protein OS493_027215, partial [Desmophyllum pertusum]